ncbi:hypothetical protein H257_03007 [Aphanomyces astaci]|uniref:WRKY19-like zinc finger domain-containing protein n=1 Tax=Aphanomyces astaci TaxID=112090 RepID=W4H0S3_APHAT|nr:hypothetical protein H257_03007 [Aphanomyces astaci]ETV85171.1 hypothetical protein H257_03007 [Aphanomyces astaci]|eukprot:XP_009825189.1 hypothetical protein H257_03007 [Aphanomyces astaci]
MQSIANERNSWTALVEEVALIESPGTASLAACDHDMVNWEDVGSIFSDALVDEASIDQAISTATTNADFDWTDLLQAFNAPVPLETQSLVFAMTTPPHSTNPRTNSKCGKATDLHPSSKKCPKKCSEPTCWNKIRSRGYCKMHGGGKRCLIPGCNTCSVGGYYCIKHGGGKKCSINGCSNAIQSRGVCKAHGGGARCTVAGCQKSSQGKGLCTSHGGGKRCEVSGCGKGAQTRGRCYAHCG